MKEASGEANMTVITILLIAVVGAVGTVIINNLMSTAKKRSCCAEVGGTLKGGSCVDSNGAAIADYKASCNDNNAPVKSEG